jgi:hypothetical protein
MPNMTSESQIKKILNDAMLKCLNEVSVEVRKDLQEYIKMDVYEDDYFPNYKYEGGNGTFGSGKPSFEFEEAFRWKETTRSTNEVKKRLYYAWENMTIDRHTGRHFEDGRDTRKELAEMLNVYGIVGNKKRSAYWDNFISVSDKVFKVYFESSMKKKGFKIVENELAWMSQFTGGTDLKSAVKGMMGAMDKFLYDIYPSLI